MSFSVSHGENVDDLMMPPCLLHPSLLKGGGSCGKPGVHFTLSQAAILCALPVVTSSARKILHQHHCSGCRRHRKLLLSVPRSLSASSGQRPAVSRQGGATPTGPARGAVLGVIWETPGGLPPRASLAMNGGVLLDVSHKADLLSLHSDHCMEWLSFSLRWYILSLPSAWRGLTAGNYMQPPQCAVQATS